MVVQLDSQHIHFTYKYPEKPSDMGLFDLIKQMERLQMGLFERLMFFLLWNK